MKVTVLTQPDPLVTVDEAKLDLGFTGTSDRDAQIRALVLAAQSELDGPTGWVGISVAEQKIEVRFDTFDDNCGKGILLPYGPIVGEIVSVDYLDEEDAEQVLDDTNYLLMTDGRLVLSTDGEWPDLSSLPEAARVTYNVGIDDADDPRRELMRSAIRLHVKMSMDMEDVETRRKAIHNLVAPLRVWHV